MDRLMQKLSRLLVSLLTFVLLSACSSAVKTVTYAPPSDPGSRMCIWQCRESQDFCDQGCGLTQRRCLIKVQAQAIRDYENYTREQYINRAPLELRPSDFERSNQCKPDECSKECVAAYNTCYESCGGKVITRSSCQFLCD